MLNYFSLHITFRKQVLAKFLCCEFLEILSNEHSGYKALLITAWQSKQRPMLTVHTLALRLQSLNYTGLSPAWECTRKSSFAEWSSKVVISDCSSPVA